MIKKIKYKIIRILGIFAPEWYKQYHELQYWKSRAKAENHNLSKDHYIYNYTDLFDLSLNWYEGKRILDIGCGPRGSLEWADMATERIGLDPLVPEYLKLGANKHKMQYVDSPSESIPFEDGYFDVVCSFNSLDHVTDYHRTVNEIKRVTKTGGTLLIIVEVNHKPTPTEPISLSWNINKDFEDSFTLVGDIKKYEIGDHNIYGQIRKDDRYNEHDSNDRVGIMVMRMERR